MIIVLYWKSEQVNDHCLALATEVEALALLSYSCRGCGIIPIHCRDVCHVPEVSSYNIISISLPLFSTVSLEQVCCI